MKCRKCGAELLDTDTFCVKCGQKVGEPMICPHCGEELREGELFCHKCGSPVENVPEDDEIPLSRQRTVDIPFDQIEQAILLEAEQAVVKRPKAEKTEKPEQRNPEDYDRPGAEEADRRRQPATEDGNLHGQKSRPRYEEEEEDEEEEDSGSSRMKLLMVILGIAVVAVALIIGFVFWQRNYPTAGERPGAGAEQGEQAGETEEDENSPDTQGRIQILSNVNVRNKPTTEGSQVLMVAKTGETYEYYELVDDAWYHIKLEDDKDGYVSAKYVEDLR